MSDATRRITGFAINAARDLGPRIAHAILPVPDKGGSDWGDALIPVIGGLTGGLFVKMAGISMPTRRLRLRFAFAVLALLAALWPATAFQQPGVHPLTGRHIAGVCGGGPCATWLERPEREQEENPEGALDALNLKPGMVVADVGSGTGYMSLKLARRVGAGGKVYAEDVQPEMLEKVRANAAKSGLKNIETIQGAYTDPKLPAGQIDVALLVDVYHEFSEPQKMLRGIRDSLKPDGRLVLLEYRKEDPTIPILAEHKMSVAEVKTELEAEGFKLGPVIEALPRQHILILTKAAAAKAAGR